MKNNFDTRKHGRERKINYIYLSSQWVAFIIQAIVGGITNIVVAAVTVVVTILVIVGGLWLAYIYLPPNTFYIILAVLIVDIALGIILRAVFLRRSGH